MSYMAPVVEAAQRVVEAASPVAVAEPRVVEAASRAVKAVPRHVSAAPVATALVVPTCGIVFHGARLAEPVTAMPSYIAPVTAAPAAAHAELVMATQIQQPLSYAVPVMPYAQPLAQPLAQDVPAKILRSMGGDWVKCLDAQGIFYFNQLTQKWGRSRRNLSPAWCGLCPPWARPEVRVQALVTEALVRERVQLQAPIQKHTEQDVALRVVQQENLRNLLAQDKAARDAHQRTLDVRVEVVEHGGAGPLQQDLVPRKVRGRKAPAVGGRRRPHLQFRRSSTRSHQSASSFLFCSSSSCVLGFWVHLPWRSRVHYVLVLACSGGGIQTQAAARKNNSNPSCFTRREFSTPLTIRMWLSDALRGLPSVSCASLVGRVDLLGLRYAVHHSDLWHFLRPSI